MKLFKAGRHPPRFPLAHLENACLDLYMEVTDAPGICCLKASITTTASHGSALGLKPVTYCQVTNLLKSSHAPI